MWLRMRRVQSARARKSPSGPLAWAPPRTSKGKGAAQPHEETHVLSSVQLGACVDSLRRAVSSAEAAANLCSKASRAFQEEVLTIRQCQTVLESYLNPQTVLLPSRPSNWWSTDDYWG